MHHARVVDPGQPIQKVTDGDGGQRSVSPLLGAHGHFENHRRVKGRAGLPREGRYGARAQRNRPGHFPRGGSGGSPGSPGRPGPRGGHPPGRRGHARHVPGPRRGQGGHLRARRRSAVHHCRRGYPRACHRLPDPYADPDQIRGHHQAGSRALTPGPGLRPPGPAPAWPPRDARF